MMEYHVILVWRHGTKTPARIYLLGPAPKRRAILTAEDTFRKENQLARNVFLMSRCLISGSEEEGMEALDKIEATAKKQKEGNDGSTDSSAGETESAGTG